MAIDKIELIPISILDQHKKLARDLNAMNKTLALSAGWHYILDWTWTVSQIEAIDGKTILDAGAGIGLLQWYLASKGAHIISVDRADRTCIPYHLVNYFNVDGLTKSDKPLNISETLNILNRRANILTRVKAITRGLLGKLLPLGHTSITGSVKLYRKDLDVLTDIPDNSVDLIVSISALEHNKTINNIKDIVGEFFRVLKPGGKMIVTLPASEEIDWFFEPAYSWCFTFSTIKDIFGITENVKSNFDQYKKVSREILNATELKNNFSLRYYFHKNSGMPWGKWDPKYIPVGLVKNK